MRKSQIFVLLIVVSLPFSGCLGDSIGSDPEIISNSVVVNEDEYVYIEFSCSDICDVEISFDQDYGPLMDMYTMTSLNYQDFQTCDEFYYIVDLSDPGTRGAERSGALESGDYVLVFDNSDCGDTAPPMNGADDSSGISYTVTID